MRSPVSTCASASIAAVVRESARRSSGIRSGSMPKPAAIGWPPKLTSSSACAASAAVMFTPATERAEARATSPGGDAMRIGRLAVPLHQPARDDADDAGGPGRVGQHQRAAFQQRRVAGDLRLGALLDLVAQQLAPGVQRLQVGGEDAGAADVACGQEIDAHVGVGQPAGCVEPRPQDEADVLLREPGRVEFGFFQQRDQARPLRAAQCSQPALEQVAGVAALERQVGDDAQRDQIEVAGRIPRPPRPFVQRLGQLVGHAHAGQVGQRMMRGIQAAWG